MASTASPLAVLIPTHGRPRLLGRTLASLAGCRLPEGYRETVVVENGARAGAEAVVAEAAKAHPHLRLRYLHVAWANKSHALNEALQTVEDGLVVFFDDDVRVAAGVLEAYAEAARQHPERAFFGGPFGVDYEAPPPEWLKRLLPYSARGVELDEGRRLGYYLGFNWAAFVRDLKSIQGFSPLYGPGSPIGTAMGDENDVQGRLRKAGVQAVGVADARVWHYVPAQRCTPKWAVRRTFYSGTARGHLSARGAQSRYVVRRCVNVGRHAVRLLRSMPIKGSPDWYVTLACLAWETGWLRGYLKGRFKLKATS